MIDLHCHLLPGIDDGPATMEDSLALARAAAAAGTTMMVATPHIDDQWGVRADEVPAAVRRVRAALAEEGIQLEVTSGGEIALARFSELSPPELDAVRLGGGPYVLIECPHSPTAGDFHAFIQMLRIRGHRIVLAHPERCPLFQQRLDPLHELVADGVLCSITASSLVGRFGQRVRRFTLGLLRDGLVHNVASDSHDPVSRSPDILTGLHAAERDLPGLGAQIDWFTREAPEAILAGGPLPPRPELPRPRRRGLLRRRGV
jgi:protein-tyrosine phosphatase